MTRLKIHSTMPLNESNQNEHYLLILYLNVRSYEAKLPDLILDPILQSSDIICLTETWLSPHKPFQFFKPNNVTFRCDRNILNAKGGVLTSTKQDFKILQYQSNTNGKYKYLTIQLQLSETLLISITNIYRSPTFHLKDFRHKLELIISSLSPNIPAIILGDFNCDITNGKNTLLLQFMTSCGFSQLVTQPTTDSRTLIDHLYVRNLPPLNTNVEVYDVYYSDNDCISLEINSS